MVTPDLIKRDYDPTLLDDFEKTIMTALNKGRWPRLRTARMHDSTEVKSLNMPGWTFRRHSKAAAQWIHVGRVFDLVEGHQYFYPLVHLTCMGVGTNVYWTRCFVSTQRARDEEWDCVSQQNDNQNLHVSGKATVQIVGSTMEIAARVQGTPWVMNSLGTRLPQSELKQPELRKMVALTEEASLFHFDDTSEHQDARKIIDDFNTTHQDILVPWFDGL